MVRCQMLEAGVCSCGTGPQAGISECPVPVAEDGRDGAVGADAVDFQVVGANHEVHVRCAFVHAALHEVLGQHLHAALVAVGEPLAQR